MCLGKEHCKNKTCTRVRNPERKEKMKKNLIVLLVIALVTVGLFAAVPEAEFQVTTSISAINAMKLTTTDIAALETVPITLGGMTEFEADVVISSQGATEAFTAYITALSNHSGGFTLKVSATPMTSKDNSATNSNKIDYTVTAGSATYTTSDTATAQTVVTSGAITKLTGISKQIAIAVDTSTFNAAVEDDYVGTVTFTYEAD